ncbi:Cdc6/Cdc18 family protein [Halalkalirubrum salinum]|uniref:Cdc6/Cdc18 family protein n=1 Tax=Halalkalirubrum salinum TaxID=2563889 RepID=UPI0010FB01B9|nr:AAA family ATPase [Halalkalirubrum salinum]
MDIDDRIARRRQLGSDPQLVLDYEPLSPLYHPDEPTGQGSMLEQLLDELDPALSGVVPSDLYVWGPKGSGKSAVITALFRGFNRIRTARNEPIHTSTRVDYARVFDFVYVDSRQATTAFSLYRSILDQLVDESVPKHGIGTEWVRNKLESALEPVQRGAVIAVDHIGEPETQPFDTLRETLSSISATISVVLIGRDPPQSIGIDADDPIEVKRFDAYRSHALIEILTTRLSDSLVRNAIAHEQLRTVATWANGDAHDALAAVFGAVIEADRSNAENVTDQYLTSAIENVPQPCVSLGRVLSLSESRLAVLRRLVALSPESLDSVGSATEAIVETDIELTAATVERLVYELAEAGITERVKTARDNDIGRPPSRIEFRFPTIPFLYLIDSGV